MSENTPASLPRHPVRLVSERTGLSPHVLRVWERRYQAVAPTRSAGGQRLYSDADIERLRLLHLATEVGRNISHIVTLPDADLRAMVRADQEAERSTPPPGPVSGPPADDTAALAGSLLQVAVEAVERLDAGLLEGALRRGIARLGLPGTVDRMIAPLLIGIGDRWHAGQLSPAHEHLATAVTRRVLDGVLQDCAAGAASRPRIVVATPSGQFHELGALLAAAEAASAGWQVTVLGVDLPLADIARAAELTGARAVALSLIYPHDDQRLAAELRQFVERLPSGVTLLLGGSATGDYAASLPEHSRVVIVPDMPAFRLRLAELAGA
jgi:MerR family transcriptional regulator, light-induced transcriptional regulator